MQERAACLKHSDFFKVNDPSPTPAQLRVGAVSGKKDAPNSAYPSADRPAEAPAERRRRQRGDDAARQQRQSRTAASLRSPMKGLHPKAGGGAAGALPPRPVYLFGGVRGAAGARLGQRLAAARRHRSRLAHPPIIVTPTRKARAHGHEQQLGRSSPSCRDGLALRMTSPKEIEMPS